MAKLVSALREGTLVIEGTLFLSDREFFWLELKPKLTCCGQHQFIRCHYVKLNLSNSVVSNTVLGSKNRISLKKGAILKNMEITESNK